MKTVRFHESINDDIGLRSNRAPLPAKFKGKRKGQKMSRKNFDLDSTKAAGVYEAIKDNGRHQVIITQSKKSPGVKAILLAVLNGLKDKDDPYFTKVKDGLQCIASKTTHPRYTELDAEEVSQYLHALAANTDFEIVLKTSEISSDHTVHTLYTIEVDGDKNDEKTAMQLALRAAFKESARRDLSVDEFMDECTKIFNTENEYYKSAFDKVTGRHSGKAGRPNDEGKMSIEDWIEKLLEVVEKGTQFLGCVQEQANSDSGSVKTYKSNCDAMRAAALSALTKWFDVTAVSSADAVGISQAIIPPGK